MYQMQQQIKMQQMQMMKYAETHGSMQMNNRMNGFQAAVATKPMSNAMFQQQAEDEKEEV